MEWFIIEALVALAIAIAIVWWTIAPSRKLPRTGDAKSVDGKPGDDKSAARKAD